MEREPLVRAGEAGEGEGKTIIGDCPNGEDGSQAAVLSAADTFHSPRSGKEAGRDD